MKTPIALDKPASLVLTMQPPEAEKITPEQLPTPWLANSAWLLEELAKTREAVLRVPLRLDNASDIKSAIDRIWYLEETMRYLLRLRAQGQSAFAQKAKTQQSGHQPGRSSKSKRSAS